MIDIYSDEYQELELLSKEGILKYISEYDIFNHYIQNLQIGGATNSPLRDKDNIPSFGVYKSLKYKNKLLFKDLATDEKGDCFILVQKMFALDYQQALNKIAADFNIDWKFYPVESTYKLVSERNGKIHSKREIREKLEYHIYIGVNKRKWNIYDRNYWMQYGITRKILEKYKVAPISTIFFNDDLIKADKLSYVYTEEKDNIIRYKIYQPFSKTKKWINNFVNGTLSGFSQLPDKGELLIVVSSLKDGMCLHALGYEFISPQAEGNLLNPNVVVDLQKRFKRIVTFYDNDEAGIKYAKRNKKMYGFDYIHTNDMFAKDISDYYIKYGKEKTKKLIKNKLNGV